MVVTQETSKVACPDCGSVRLVRDYERGELICAGCGLVLVERVMDYGPDWAPYDDGDGRRRAGDPVLQRFHDRGLSTVIQVYGAYPPERRAQLRRMSRLQRGGWRRNSLPTGLLEITRMCSVLSLPKDAAERASIHYRKALGNGRSLLLGRSVEALAAACVYLACREGGLPRSLPEVAGASRVRKKQVVRAYIALKRALGVSLPPLSPREFVPQLASRLGLGPEVQGRALEILGRLPPTGNSNVNLAACALRIAAGELGVSVDNREVAEAAGLTDVAIRETSKRLLRLLRSSPSRPSS